MTGVSASTDPPPRAHVPAAPSVRTLIVQHKRVSLAILLVLIAFVGLLVPGMVGAGSWTVTDATSCSAWSSANHNQQAAYARLYVKEHGPLASGASSAGSIEAAINNGCLGAFAYDEPDTVNVVQALKGRY